MISQWHIGTGFFTKHFIPGIAWQSFIQTLAFKSLPHSQFAWAYDKKSVAYLLHKPSLPDILHSMTSNLTELFHYYQTKKCWFVKANSTCLISTCAKTTNSSQLYQVCLEQIPCTCTCVAIKNKLKSVAIVCFLLK